MSESYTLTLSAGTATPASNAVWELAFGSYGPNNTQVTADGLIFGSGAAGGSISFADGAGVFQGVAPGAWAPSPTNQNTVEGVTTDYLAAVQSGAVTIDFSSTQEYFGLLWGSLNSGNTLSFYNGTTLAATITADDLLNDYGATSQGNYFVSINIPGGYTSVVASSSSGGFEFTNVSYAATPITDPFGGPGATLPVVPYDPSTSSYLCFLAGTMIAVPGGAMAVEQLRPGMPVLTAGGQAEPVRWLGQRSVNARFADPLRAYPVRITAGALEDGVPSHDLLVSPDHALLVDGILIQASALVNGASIQCEAEMPESFTYYHVELASHALILAEGMPAETFVDNADHGHFDNWDTHPDDGAVTEMDLPRAKSARQIPASTKAKLLARAQRKAA